MAATPGDTVASSGIWAISPGGAGGRPNAQAGKGRGGRVPGSFEVNQSGPKLGSGLIDPTLTSCTPFGWKVTIFSISFVSPKPEPPGPLMTGIQMGFGGVFPFFPSNDDPDLVRGWVVSLPPLLVEPAPSLGMSEGLMSIPPSTFALDLRCWRGDTGFGNVRKSGSG